MDQEVRQIPADEAGSSREVPVLDWKGLRDFRFQAENSQELFEAAGRKYRRIDLYWGEENGKENGGNNGINRYRLKEISGMSNLRERAGYKQNTASLVIPEGMSLEELIKKGVLGVAFGGWTSDAKRLYLELPTESGEKKLETCTKDWYDALGNKDEDTDVPLGWLVVNAASGEGVTYLSEAVEAMKITGGGTQAGLVGTDGRYFGSFIGTLAAGLPPWKCFIWGHSRGGWLAIDTAVNVNYILRYQHQQGLWELFDKEWEEKLQVGIPTTDDEADPLLQYSKLLRQYQQLLRSGQESEGNISLQNLRATLDDCYRKLLGHNQDDGARNQHFALLEIYHSRLNQMEWLTRGSGGVYCFGEATAMVRSNSQTARQFEALGASMGIPDLLSWIRLHGFAGNIVGLAAGPITSVAGFQAGGEKAVVDVGVRMHNDVLEDMRRKYGSMSPASYVIAELQLGEEEKSQGGLNPPDLSFVKIGVRRADLLVKADDVRDALLWIMRTGEIKPFDRWAERFGIPPDEMVEILLDEGWGPHYAMMYQKGSELITKHIREIATDMAETKKLGPFLQGQLSELSAVGLPLPLMQYEAGQNGERITAGGKDWEQVFSEYRQLTQRSRLISSLSRIDDLIKSKWSGIVRGNNIPMRQGLVDEIMEVVHSEWLISYLDKMKPELAGRFRQTGLQRLTALETIVEIVEDVLNNPNGLVTCNDALWNQEAKRVRKQLEWLSPALKTLGFHSNIWKDESTVSFAKSHNRWLDRGAKDKSLAAYLPQGINYPRLRLPAFMARQMEQFLEGKGMTDKWTIAVKEKEEEWREEVRLIVNQEVGELGLNEEQLGLLYNFPWHYGDHIDDSILRKRLQRLNKTVGSKMSEKTLRRIFTRLFGDKGQVLK